jgi:site-specific recombinase XerC
MPFATWQLRFQEHLAATQPCTELAEWFAEALVPFFHHVRGLGVSQVESLAVRHIESARQFHADMRWQPPQASKWDGALFPVRKPPLRFLAPAQKFFAVRLFVHFLWRSGVLSENLAAAVQRLPVLPKQRRDLTRMDAEAMLLAAGLAVACRQSPLALRDQAVLSLVYRDGVRPLEVRSARFNPAAQACGELHVRPRRAPEQRLPLSPPTVAHLRAYLNEARSKLEQGQAQTALFLTLDGTALDDGELRALVSDAAREAGLPLAMTPNALYSAGWAHRRAQACSVESPELATVSMKR